MLREMSFPSPPMPAIEATQSNTEKLYLRYEDITQDARLIPIAIPPALGGLWHTVLVDHPGARNAIKQGVLPILTRMTMVAHDQPIRIDREVEISAGFQLAHDREGDAISRLFMNVWCELRGVGGRIGKRGDGELVPAGSLFAEHTFTRLLAPPDQRRVVRLDVEGYPAIPDARYRAPAPATAQDAPDGARWLDELTADPAEQCFTLDQTDSNQHVNSLVYIRLFLEAVNRRLASGGHSLKVKTKAIDIAYRKPSFAGDRVRVHLRLYEAGGSLGAAGHIAGDDGKPRCYVRASLAA